MTITDDLRCLFCGARKADVRRMVLAEDTGAVICDDCVRQCVDLLIEDRDEVVQKPGDGAATPNQEKDGR